MSEDISLLRFPGRPLQLLERVEIPIEVADSKMVMAPRIEISRRNNQVLKPCEHFWTDHYPPRCSQLKGCIVETLTHHSFRFAGHIEIKPTYLCLAVQTTGADVQDVLSGL